MSQAEKYHITDTQGTTQFARQVRLDREVTIHQLPASSPSHAGQIAEILSRMSRLDHPGIPHLLDVLDADDGVQMVTETFAGNRFEVPTDLPDALVLAEKLASVISHAHQRGVAHGELSDSSIGCDAQQEAKLIGLGLAQCKQNPSTTDELFASDYSNLQSLVGQIVRRAISPSQADDTTEEAESKSPSDRVDALEKMFREHTTATEFHAAFQPWLKRELMLIEAEQLSVVSLQNETGRTFPRFLRTREGQIILGGVTAVLLILSAFAAWPPSDRSLAASNNTTSSATLHTRETIPSPKGSNIDLGSVGALNNPAPADSPATDTESDTQSLPLADLDAKSDLELSAPIELSADGPNHPPAIRPAPKDPDSTRSSETSAAAEATPDTVAMSVAEEPEKPSSNNRKSSPFADSPAAIDLPTDRADTNPVIVATTDLLEREPLVIELLGGAGAHRSAKFALVSIANEPANPSSKKAWDVVMSNKSTESSIARLERVGEHITFAWLPAAAPARNGDYLGNCLLSLRSKKWWHRVSLRTPVQVDSFKPDLNRLRPYDVAGLKQAPNLDELFLEFVPSKDNVAIARPQAIPLRNGSMRIGLDAGKKSLVFLHLRSDSRGRLKPQVFVRETLNSKPRMTRKGFTQQMSVSMLKLQAELVAGKEASRKLRGRDRPLQKKQVDQRIDQLEDMIESAESFAQAWAAASQTTLAFRVYRKVGQRELEIVRIGSQSEE